LSTPLLLVEFLLGTIVSLGTSWALVSRIERVGRRLDASEAMLGLIAALAADTPEITSAVSALAHHEQAVGAGVVVGSNVFNLAALLGLGAVVAGRIALHRRVVLLEGAVALWVAATSVMTIVGVLPPVAGLVMVAAVLAPYVVLAAVKRHQVEGLPVGPRLRRWLRTTLVEEELELKGAIERRRGGPVDFVVALLAVVVVVGASVVMERAASTLGHRLQVPDIVTGGVLLAAVTSLPNAVAAVFLARRGRGPAVLSTALNSNALNIAAGLLLPAAVLGLGRATADEVVLTCWYAGLTLMALAFSYRGRGLRRGPGSWVLGAYASFVVVLVVCTSAAPADRWLFVLQAVVVAAIGGLLLLRRPV
jgi:cation:H+ antiporter